MNKYLNLSKGDILYTMSVKHIADEIVFLRNKHNNKQVKQHV